MDNAKRIARLKDEEFQRIFGVKKIIFNEMLQILEEQYRNDHKQGGHPVKLSILDKLVIMLGYYRDYRTMENIAFDYGVAKSTIYESIRWAENTLIKSGKFSLPSKKALVNDLDIEVVLVDVTECEVERPQKNKSKSCTIPAKRNGIP